MREDTTFSENKLTTEEFSKKYWLAGLALDQYHTATIEDGRDEREQLIINNIRALNKKIEFYAEYGCGNAMKRLREASRKSTMLVVTGMVISTIAGIIGIIALIHSCLK